MGYRAVWLVAVSAGALMASPVLAADEDRGVVEEAVVTAQKRAENVQSVPLSIIAVSEKAMEARGVDDARDLERIVPSLRLDTIAQASGVSIRIRGFGANSNAAIDPSVAPYIDGVFIPRPGAILSTFLDVESVEVLRGPQGTLFGRNATVGALSVNTHAPDLSGFSAKVAGQIGRFDEHQVDGFINLPVNDRFALRLAGLATETDGYVRNRADGKTYGKKDTVAGRLSAKWRVTDDLTWTGRVDYARTTGDGVNFTQIDTSTATAAQLAAFSARLGGNPPTLQYRPSLTTNQVFSNLNLTDRQYGLTSDLTYETPGGYAVRMINAYRDWRNVQSDGDTVNLTLDLLSRDSTFDSESQSHELQLISPKGALLGGKLDFVAGLYYFDEDYVIGEALNLGSRYCDFLVAGAAPALLGACNTVPKIRAADGLFTQSAESRAVYGQVNVKLLPTIEVSFGARQTWDRKTGTFVQALGNPAAALLRGAENTALKLKDDRPSWRANVSWQTTPDVMAFVTYSTGYKSGGLNSAGGAAALGQKRLFDSETSTDWEAGVKSVLFERRLLLNITAFRTELDDFQERSFDGVSFLIRNAGDIRAQGVELEGQARPTQNLTFDFGVALLDATFTSNRAAPGLPACNNSPTSCPTVQDLTGRTPTYSPKWQGNLGAQYTTDPFAGGFTASARLEVAYTSAFYATNDLNPQGRIDAYQLYSGRLALVSPDQTWNVALFGENLTDEHYFRGKFVQTLDGVLGVRLPATGATLLRGYLGAPGTWGVRAAKTF
ncbi:MAG: TonB-dependent receptor [Phenylobacterium sp.]|uniref:TonB-dependent receptor n=1 Tax=Phenylobacterium sp. TaxID=1871053 RepID=UPI001A21F58A|nr:TonB-dependent receptor [Phenylobacterium sp.]MBJ7408803.1 TonB-dependent receptor [Phenylobacterium sp.]